MTPQKTPQEIARRIIRGYLKAEEKWPSCHQNATQLEHYIAAAIQAERDAKPAKPVFIKLESPKEPLALPSLAEAREAERLAARRMHASRTQYDATNYVDVLIKQREYDEAHAAYDAARAKVDELEKELK